MKKLILILFSALSIELYSSQSKKIFCINNPLTHNTAVFVDIEEMQQRCPEHIFDVKNPDIRKDLDACLKKPLKIKVDTFTAEDTFLKLSYSGEIARGLGSYGKTVTSYEELPQVLLGDIPEDLTHFMENILFKKNGYQGAGHYKNNVLLVSGENYSGKKYALHHMCSALQIPYYSLDVWRLGSYHQGNSSKRIDLFFDYIKTRTEPLCIVIDSFDSIVRLTQGGELDSYPQSSYLIRTVDGRDVPQAAEENRDAAAALLRQLKSLESHKNIFVAIITNNPEKVNKVASFKDEKWGRLTSSYFETKPLSRHEDIIKMFTLAFERYNCAVSDEIVKTTTQKFIKKTQGWFTRTDYTNILFDSIARKESYNDKAVRSEDGKKHIDQNSIDTSMKECLAYSSIKRPTKNIPF